MRRKQIVHTSDLLEIELAMRLVCEVEFEFKFK